MVKRPQFFLVILPHVPGVRCSACHLLLIELAELLPDKVGRLEEKRVDVKVEDSRVFREQQGIQESVRGARFE